MANKILTEKEFGLLGSGVTGRGVTKDSGGRQEYGDATGNTYYRNERNIGTPQYTVDYEMIPKALPESSLVATSAPARSKYTENSIFLDDALKKYSAGIYNNNQQTGTEEVVEKPEEDVILGSNEDPFIKELDAMAARANDSSRILIENIKASKLKQQNRVTDTYDRYKSGLQLLGIQTNAAAATPELLVGHLQQAEKEQEAKISELEAEEVKALVDAENARAENNFKILQEKTEYIKRVRAEKATALKTYHDLVSDNAEKTEKEGKEVAKVMAYDIFSTLETIEDADKEEFIMAIAQKFNIPPISLMSALVDEQKEREKNKKAEKKEENPDDKELSRTDLEAYNAQGYKLPLGTTYGQVKKMGIIPKDVTKPPTPKAVTETQKEKDEIQKGKNVLASGKLPDGTVIGKPKGADGFYDPTVYIKLFERWTGTPKDFVSKYPIVGSINPASYSELPGALKELAPKPKGRDL